MAHFWKGGPLSSICDCLRLAGNVERAKSAQRGPLAQRQACLTTSSSRSAPDGVSARVGGWCHVFAIHWLVCDKSVPGRNLAPGRRTGWAGPGAPDMHWGQVGAWTSEQVNRNNENNNNNNKAQQWLGNNGRAALCARIRALSSQEGERAARALRVGRACERCERSVWSARESPALIAHPLGRAPDAQQWPSD